MKTTLITCAAVLAALSLNGDSLMPAKGRISIAGADGTSFRAKDGTLTLKREKPTFQQFMRGIIRFKPHLDGNFAQDDALVIELKTAKDFDLRLRWRKSDRMMCHLDNVPVKAGKGFQEIVVPMPVTGGKALESLDIQLSPDPGMVEIRKIAIEKPKKVTLAITSPITKAQDELVFKGTTAAPETDVKICIRNSRGEVKSKTVKSKQGKFELRWKRPPVNIGLWNTAYAEIGDGKASANVSIPLRVFGYRANDNYAWLKVKGRDIVTSKESKGGEQAFIPVGIGYCRDVIIPAQDDEVMKYCKERGLNTVRLPFYTRFFNNRESEPLDIDEHIRDFVLPVVLAAKRHNLYVILDDHGYFTAKIDEAKARQKQSAPRWNEAGFNEWIRRWVKVAEFFKNEPTVLGYELLNEPHDIPHETTRKWYTNCLKAIRKVDQRHIVLLGNADWSHSRTIEKTWGPVASTVDAPYNNVVFSFHDYPEDNHPWIVADHITKFQKKHNVPVMCTEFGATHWNKSETVCRTFISGVITLFARENTGWMIWALKYLKDNPRAPYNPVDKVGINPPSYDSCSYSDIWIPAAKIMASPFPKAK